MKSSGIALTNRALAHVYESIGGEPGLDRILKTFYRRMASDLLLEHFFVGKDVDHIAQQQKHFLMKAMGGIASYAGIAPAEAHRHIPNILKGHFDRRLFLLRQVLEECKVPPEDIETWLRFENAFRKAIEVEEGPR